MAFTKESAVEAGKRSVAKREQRKLEHRLAVLGSTGTRVIDVSTALPVLEANQRTVTSMERESKALAELQVNRLLKNKKSEIVDAQKLKILVETADKLYGWSRSDAPSTMVQVNYLSELKPEDVPQPVVVGAVQAKPDSVSG